MQFISGLLGGSHTPDAVVETYDAMMEEYQIPLSLSEEMHINISPEKYGEIFDKIVNMEKMEEEKGNIFSPDTYVRIGNFMYLNGNIRKAKEYYNKAILKTRNNPYSWNSKAFVLFIEEKNMIDARKCFEEALKIHPNYATAMSSLSYLLLESGEIKTAADVVERALKTNPEDVRSMAMKALVQKEQGDAAGALSLIDSAIKKKPMAIMSHLVKGDILNTLNDNFRARDEFLIVLKMLEDKRHFKGLKARAYIGIAIAYMGLGQIDDALQALTSAVKLYPKDAKILLLKAAAHDEIGDEKNAIRYYTMANVQSDKQSDMWYAKALSGMLKGNLASAHDSIKRAIFQEPTNSRYLSTLAQILFMKENVDDAIKYANKAIELNPKSFKAWKIKAEILECMGSKKLAIEAYENAVKFYPYAKDILEKLYATYKENNDEKAIALVDKLITVDEKNMAYRMDKLRYSILQGEHDTVVNSLNDLLRAGKPDGNEILSLIPSLDEMGLTKERFRILDYIIMNDYPDDIKAKAYLAKANYYEEAEIYDRALEMLLKYLEYNPDDLDSLFTLGETYETLGEFNKALDIFNDILKKDPTSSDAWFGKGSTYDELGNYDEAIKCYLKAVEIDPDDLDIWYNLGVAHHNAGFLDEAEECFSYILNKDPDNEDALKARKLVILEKLGMDTQSDLYLDQ